MGVQDSVMLWHRVAMMMTMMQMMKMKMVISRWCRREGVDQQRAGGYRGGVSRGRRP